MSKILNYFESIKWILHLKRLGAFVVNYLILIIPIIIVSAVLYTETYPYFMDGGSAFGLTVVWVGIMAIFPVIFSVYFYTNGLFLHTVFQFSIIFFAYFSINTLAGLIIRNDIGSLPFGLIIVDKSGRRAARWRIVIRTFLKYLTVFLCPILLLLPLFNRRQACLHELLSGAYKVEKTVTYYPPVQTQGQ